jgi:hypothetical protein
MIIFIYDSIWRTFLLPMPLRHRIFRFDAWQYALGCQRNPLSSQLKLRGFSPSWSCWRSLISRSERLSRNRTINEDVNPKSAVISYDIYNPIGQHPILCLFRHLSRRCRGLWMNIGFSWNCGRSWAGIRYCRFSSHHSYKVERYHNVSDIRGLVNSERSEANRALPKSQGWPKTRHGIIVDHDSKFTYRACYSLCNGTQLEIDSFVSQEHEYYYLGNWDLILKNARMLRLKRNYVQKIGFNELFHVSMWMQNLSTFISSKLFHERSEICTNDRICCNKMSETKSQSALWKLRFDFVRASVLRGSHEDCRRLRWFLITVTSGIM